MKYTDFYKELLREGEKTNSFGTLPDIHPYGFVVWPTGEFAVVEDWGGHEKVSGKWNGGMTGIIRSGGIRIAASKRYGPNVTYNFTYLGKVTTQKAKKTAKDLADYYKIEQRWDEASDWIMNEGVANIIEEDWENIKLDEEYPSTWNKDEFEKIQSFSGKLKYASTHLPKIASGSGRAVFKIDDSKVLKIAKNKKGLAQNNVESEYLLQKYDITARTFDRGDVVKNIGPFWIEMELAKKLTPTKFKELAGIDIKDLDSYIFRSAMKRLVAMHSPNHKAEPHRKDEEIENNQFFQDVMRLSNDYGMKNGDFGRLSSYGLVLRDGKPKIVLVDFGLTKTVFDDYYKVKL